MVCLLCGKGCLVLFVLFVCLFMGCCLGLVSLGGGVGLFETEMSLHSNGFCPCKERNAYQF